MNLFDYTIMHYYELSSILPLHFVETPYYSSLVVLRCFNSILRILYVQFNAQAASVAVQ